MDPKKAKQLHDELGILLSRYGLDGMAGVLIKRGVMDGGIMLYDPADLPTRTVVLALNEKLTATMKSMTGCRVEEHTGLTGQNPANN